MDFAPAKESLVQMWYEYEYDLAIKIAREDCGNAVYGNMVRGMRRLRWPHSR